MSYSSNRSDHPGRNDRYDRNDRDSYDGRGNDRFGRDRHDNSGGYNSKYGHGRRRSRSRSPPSRNSNYRPSDDRSYRDTDYKRRGDDSRNDNSRVGRGRSPDNYCDRLPPKSSLSKSHDSHRGRGRGRGGGRNGAFVRGYSRSRSPSRESDVELSSMLDRYSGELREVPTLKTISHSSSVSQPVGTTVESSASEKMVENIVDSESSSNAAPSETSSALLESAEDDIAAMLGFGGFGSTKGKQVADNVVGASRGYVKTTLKRDYRQYLDRKGVSGGAMLTSKTYK